MALTRVRVISDLGDKEFTHNSDYSKILFRNYVIGVAASQTPGVVYGVVDLYGMAVKVTIVHNHNHSERLRRNNAIMRALSPDVGRPRPALSLTPEPDVPDRLLFHSNCGQKAAIISEGRTALRPQWVHLIQN